MGKAPSNANLQTQISFMTGGKYIKICSNKCTNKACVMTDNNICIDTDGVPPDIFSW